MNKRSRPMHRTTTSAEVKNRWNAAHYDRIVVNVPKGAAAEVKAAAKAHGLTVAAYIRMLIIHDTAEKPETTRNLRGGGVTDAWQRFADKIREPGEDPEELPGQLRLEQMRSNALLRLQGTE